MIPFNHLLITLLSLTITIPSLASPSPDAEIASLPPPSLFDKRAITCAPPSKCTYNDNRLCYLSINAKGTQSIQVQGKTWTTLCQLGGCEWRGKGVKGKASSYARDVARGGWTSVTQCANNNGAGGRNYAHGNGDFQVEIVPS
ncbi:hypothetical protein TWF281_004449 [Arthrobotrys megalospora]